MRTRIAVVLLVLAIGHIAPAQETEDGWLYGEALAATRITLISGTVYPREFPVAPDRTEPVWILEGRARNDSGRDLMSVAFRLDFTKDSSVIARGPGWGTRPGGDFATYRWPAGATMNVTALCYHPLHLKQADRSAVDEARAALRATSPADCTRTVTVTRARATQ